MNLKVFSLKVLIFIFANVFTFSLSAQAFDLAINPADTTICSGASVVLTAEYDIETTNLVGFVWSTGIEDVDVIEISPIETTVYSVTATNDLGESEETSAIIYVIDNAIAGADITNNTCNGAADGRIEVVPLGTPPFLYEWSNGATSNPISELSAGEYNVTTTSALGCSSTATFEITEPSAISFATTISDVSCIGGSDGFVLAPAIGGTAPYSYLWDDGFSEADRNLVPAGEYTLTVTDANGCEYSEVFSIGTASEFLAPVIDLEATQVTSTLCGGSTGAIDLVIESGTPPFEFGWNGFPLFFNSTDEDITDLQSNSYEVFVYDANGCNTSAVFVVEQEGQTMELDEELTTIEHNRCAGSITGSIDLIINGGVEPLTYSWSDGGANSAMRWNLFSGFYQVTVTDAIGCTLEGLEFEVGELEAFTVNQPASYVVDVNCHGNDDGEIVLALENGTPPYHYEVEFQNGLELFFYDLSSLDNLPAGQYEIVALDAYCHAASVMFTISEPEALVLNNTETVLYLNCENHEENLITPAVTGGTPPYSFEWSNGATSSSLANVTLGEYVVTITDQCGASVIDLYELSEDGSVTAFVDATICASDSLEIGEEVFQETGVYVIDLPSITNPNCDSTIILNLTVQPPMYMDVGDDFHVCVGGQSWLSPSAYPSGALYHWSPSLLVVDSTSVTTYANLVSDQTFTLTAIRDGCSISDSLHITVDPSYNPVADAGLDLIVCGEGSVELGGSPTGSSSPGNPSDFAVGARWRSFNSGSLISTQSNPTINIMATDTFQVEVFSSSGCESLDTIIVEVLDSVQIKTTVTDVSCQGTMDGMINVSVGSGTPPFTYEWMDGNMDAQRTDLAAGSYHLTVTDAVDCSIVQSPIVVNEPLFDWEFTVVQPTCDGLTTGSIIMELDVDQEWSVSWSNGATDVNSISDLIGGEYCVTVSLNENCSQSRCFTINELIDQTCGVVMGHIRQDNNEDCIVQDTELGLRGWLVVANTGDEEYHTLTDSTGYYEFSLPLGTYALTALAPGTAWDSCPIADVEVTNQQDTILQNINVPAIQPCSEVMVSLSTPNLRRCFTSAYYVHICNTGNTDTEPFILDLELDDFLSFDSSTVTPVEIVGQDIRWVWPSMPLNSCATFTVYVNVSCDAELGQAHCSVISASNNGLETICVPIDDNWSGVDLEMNSSCTESIVTFEITNTSEYDLNESLPYQILRDSAILSEGELNELLAGDSRTFTVSSNGETYTMRLAQVEGHPFSIELVNSIEGCGVDENGDFVTGITTLLPQSDNTPNTFTLCEENRGAYDPNDKRGRPEGIGTMHNVFPQTEINYQIRFQNTGTDTAFTVVIRDQLSEDLDLNTFRHSAASHEYSLRLLENRTLVFTFNDIMLPDSTTNLAASQGFVDFYIRPRADLLLGTTIENDAAIYFDFNEPIYTNRTWHTVNEGFLDVINWLPVHAQLEVNWKAFPNPTKDQLMIELVGQQWPEQVDLLLYDANGRLLQQTNMEHKTYVLDLTKFNNGWYEIQLVGDDGLLGTGRLIKQ